MDYNRQTSKKDTLDFSRCANCEMAHLTRSRGYLEDLCHPDFWHTLTLTLDQESLPAAPTNLSKSTSSCVVHPALPLLFAEAGNLSSRDS